MDTLSPSTVLSEAQPKPRNGAARVLLTIFVGLTLTACGAEPNIADAEEPPPADVRWEGTYAVMLTSSASGETNSTKRLPENSDNIFLIRVGLSPELFIDSPTLFFSQAVSSSETVKGTFQTTWREVDDHNCQGAPDPACDLPPDVYNHKTTTRIALSRPDTFSYTVTHTVNGTLADESTYLGRYQQLSTGPESPECSSFGFRNCPEAP